MEPKFSEWDIVWVRGYVFPQLTPEDRKRLRKSGMKAVIHGVLSGPDIDGTAQYGYEICALQDIKGGHISTLLDTEVFEGELSVEQIQDDMRDVEPPVCPYCGEQMSVSIYTGYDIFPYWDCECTYEEMEKRCVNRWTEEC